MSKRGEYVWFDGKTLKSDDAKIGLFTHALHYGSGAFEGIRAYRQAKGGGAVFRLHDHMERFFESFKIMGLTLPYSQDEITRASIELCMRNGFEECYIRPIGFIGNVTLSVYPGENPPISVAILTWEWGHYLGAQGATQGARLKTSTFLRPHVNSVMTKGKLTGQYLTGVLAKREAKQQGFDEALFVDPEGYVTEGSGENVFLVKGGVVKTAPPTSILNGITRRTIIEYLTQQGMPVIEQRFTRDELWCADEVFMTGTAAEITPVREIDLRPIGSGDHAGKPGPLSLRLQKEYQQLVRGERPPLHSNWLSPIA